MSTTGTPEPEGLRVPKLPANVLVYLLVAILPTGAAGGVGFKLQGVTDKLDKILDAQTRLETRLQGYERLEERVRDLEEFRSAARVTLEAAKVTLERLDRERH